MKTTLVFVSTLDGKVTKWGDPFVRLWSSADDQQYFTGLWNNTRLIVMGRNTYFADPMQPSSDHLLVVMTQHASEYKGIEIPGELEFTDESPVQLFERFDKTGQDQMLIVGGAHIATSFFKEQLVDELWLTIEPKIFGTGGSFVIEEPLNINLQLISCEQVNTRGTLITKYEVIKNKNIKLKN
jgi:dihydrofolate reductase